jgi:hypothetical protein
MTNETEVQGPSINSQIANQPIVTTPGVPEAHSVPHEPNALELLNQEVEALYHNLEQKVEQRKQLEQVLQSLQERKKSQQIQQQQAIEALKQIRVKYNPLIGSLIYLSDFSETLQKNEEQEAHIKSQIKFEEEINVLRNRISNSQKQYDEQLARQQTLLVELFKLRGSLPQPEQEKRNSQQKLPILDELNKDKENTPTILSEGENQLPLQFSQHRVRQEKISLLEQQTAEIALQVNATQEALDQYKHELYEKTKYLQEPQHNDDAFEKNKQQIQQFRPMLDLLAQKRVAYIEISERLQTTNQQNERVKELTTEIEQAQQQIQSLNEEVTKLSSQKELLLARFSPLEQAMLQQLDELGMELSKFNQSRTSNIKRAATDEQLNVLMEMIATSDENTPSGEEQQARIQAAAAAEAQKHQQIPQDLQAKFDTVANQLAFSQQQAEKWQNQFEALLPAPSPVAIDAAIVPEQPVVQPMPKTTAAPLSSSNPAPSQPVAPTKKRNRLMSLFSRNKSGAELNNTGSVTTKTNKPRANSTPVVRVAESVAPALPPAHSAPIVNAKLVVPPTEPVLTRSMQPTDDFDPTTDSSEGFSQIQWADEGSVTFSIRKPRQVPDETSTTSTKTTGNITPVSARSTADYSAVSTPDTISWGGFESPLVQPNAAIMEELANDPLSLTIKEFREPSNAQEATVAIQALQSEIDKFEEYRSRLVTIKKQADSGILTAEDKAQFLHFERELSRNSPPGSPSVKSQLSPSSKGMYQADQEISQSADFQLTETKAFLQQLKDQLADIKQQFPEAEELAVLLQEQPQAHSEDEINEINNSQQSLAELSSVQPIPMEPALSQQEQDRSYAASDEQPAAAPMAKSNSSEQVIIPAEIELDDEPAPTVSRWKQLKNAVSKTVNNIGSTISSAWSAITNPEVKTAIIEHDEEDEAASEAASAASIAEPPAIVLAKQEVSPSFTTSKSSSSKASAYVPTTPPKRPEQQKEASVGEDEADTEESIYSEHTFNFASESAYEDEVKYLASKEGDNEDDNDYTLILTPALTKEEIAQAKAAETRKRSGAISLTPISDMNITDPHATENNQSEDEDEAGTFFDVQEDVFNSDNTSDTDNEPGDEEFLSYDSDSAEEDDERTPLVSIAEQQSLHIRPVIGNQPLATQRSLSAYNSYSSDEEDSDDDLGPIVVHTTSKEPSSNSNPSLLQQLSELPGRFTNFFSRSQAPAEEKAHKKDKGKQSQSKENSAPIEMVNMASPQTSSNNAKKTTKSSGKQQKGLLRRFNRSKASVGGGGNEEIAIQEMPPASANKAQALNGSGLFHHPDESFDTDSSSSSSLARGRGRAFGSAHDARQFGYANENVTPSRIPTLSSELGDDTSYNEHNERRHSSLSHAADDSTDSFIDFGYSSHPTVIHRPAPSSDISSTHSSPSAPAQRKVEMELEELPENQLMQNLIEWAQIDADGVQRSYAPRGCGDPTVFTATFQKADEAPKEFVVLTADNKVEAFGDNCQENVYLEMAKVLVGDVKYATPPLVPISITKQLPIEEAVQIFIAVSFYNAVPYIEQLALPYTHAQIEAQLPSKTRSHLTELIKQLSADDKNEYDEGYKQPSKAVVQAASNEHVSKIHREIEQHVRPEMMH